MKALLFALTGIMAIGNYAGNTVAANTVAAFSTLGDPAHYDATTGAAVRGATATTFTIYAGHANQFTAAYSGLLSSIDLGITFPFYAANRQVDVRLALDVNDFLPPPTALTTGTVTAAGSFETGQNSALTVFTPASEVSIVAGQKYWLILLPHDTKTDIVWNQNTEGILGRFAATYYNANSWGQNPSDTMRAFRVNVTLVPEPTALTLWLAGSLLLAIPRLRCREK